MLPSGYPLLPSKKFNQFGQAVWLAIANIYTNIYIYMSKELYYIEDIFYKSGNLRSSLKKIKPNGSGFI